MIRFHQKKNYGNRFLRVSRTIPPQKKDIIFSKDTFFKYLSQPGRPGLPGDVPSLCCGVVTLAGRAVCLSLSFVPAGQPRIKPKQFYFAA